MLTAAALAVLAGTRLPDRTDKPAMDDLSAEGLLTPADAPVEEEDRKKSSCLRSSIREAVEARAK